ncbi:DUF4030 domain-containing protein [Fictibacillus sp. 5RED26]|uniref:DUF4030 domain-containing protein n=1 Tax=Fictibacillus sp. 5RED26 TaxID=2745876 RepID=UPI0018CFE2FA|nr:DUF4030 domain-containing protein [Fictibacillus sp. 5RED26]MBH0158691.1 DUF4030 domain-containing protein [Fictibacillus sp. 5RED26]
MEKYLKENVKNEIDKVKIPEEKLNQRIKIAINKGKKEQHRYSNKTFYISAAAAILFVLLMSSSLVSPVMANVVSKIPLLNQVFGSKDIVTHISEELLAKGYKISGVGVSVPEKELIIGIKGSEEYFEDVKGDVETISGSILEARNYDAYTQKIMLSNESKDDLLEKDKEKRETADLEYEKIHTIVTTELRKQEYKFLSLSMSSNPKTIQIDIPDTETRIIELKKTVNDVLIKNNLKTLPLNIKKIDMERRELDKKWLGILDIVGEELLGKRDYNVSTVGYSIDPVPEIQAFITLSSSEENSKDFAKQLEKVIDDFLKSDQMKSKIGNDTYKITIYSNDNKIIN